MREQFETTPFGRRPVTLGQRSGRRADVARRCDSPIELILAGRLLFELKTHCAGRNLALIPQFEFGRSRYDFAIRMKGEQHPRVLIDYGGNEFHSRPERLANDRNKDALALSIGAVMFRFKGSDIHHNALACVRRVVETVLNTIKEARSA